MSPADYPATTPEHERRLRREAVAEVVLFVLWAVALTALPVVLWVTR